MSIKEFKEAFAQYDDNAEVIVSICNDDEKCICYANEHYDTFIEGNEDIWYDCELARNPESNKVYIKIYKQ